MSTPEEFWILCAPIDAAFATVGSVSHHRCSKCGKGVLLSQSGQQFLRANPGAKLVCSCSMDEALKANAHALCGPLDDVLREIKTSRPNPHRRRN